MQLIEFYKTQVVLFEHQPHLLYHDMLYIDDIKNIKKNDFGIE
jgi:hypothetical protein